MNGTDKTQCCANVAEFSSVGMHWAGHFYRQHLHIVSSTTGCLHHTTLCDICSFGSFVTERKLVLVEKSWFSVSSSIVLTNPLTSLFFSQQNVHLQNPKTLLSSWVKLRRLNVCSYSSFISSGEIIQAVRRAAAGLGWGQGHRLVH